MNRSFFLVSFSFALALLPLWAADETPKPEKTTPISAVLIDAASKKHDLKEYEFTFGTRRLGWLASSDEKPEKPTKGKKGRVARTPKQGPEAFVVRDDLKINFLAGVVTLVPLTQLREISFDEEKQTMTARAAINGKKEDDVKLVGTTKYKNINKFTLEADIKIGDGVATQTYLGGVPAKGVQSISFAIGEVEAAKPGRPAVVVTADGEATRTHKVWDLQPLYQSGTKETVSNTLHFKKTLKLDITKMEKISLSSEEGRSVVWEVKPKDGEAATLTLIENAGTEEQELDLVGLVARVPEGWKLFPVKRIKSIVFDAKEEPKEGTKKESKEEPKKEK
jgi:hypothetical protein